MGEANLAIVLGPNLLRPRHESMLRMIEDARHVNGVIQSLLEEYEFLVSGESNRPKKEENRGAGPSSPSSEEKGEEKSADHLKTEEPLNEQELQHAIDAGPASAIQRLTAMKETAIAKAVLLAEENGLIIPPPTPPEFDLANPLEYAIGKLKQIYIKENRPFTIESMTVQQRRQEKADIKWELRNYDLAFQARFGHLPTKQDKEVLRPLYERYRTLADLLDNEVENEPPKIQLENISLPLENNEEYNKLREEKRALQRYLHQYQTIFITKNRRRMQYLQDREPIKTEYANYKALKQKIKAMEESAKSSSS